VSKKKKPAKFDLDGWLQLNNQRWLDVFLSTRPKLTEVLLKHMLSELTRRARAFLIAALPPDITGNDFKKFDEWLLDQPRTQEERAATVLIAQASTLWHLCLDARGRKGSTKTDIAFNAIGLVWSSLYQDDWKWIMYDAQQGRAFRYGPKRKRTDNLTREMERAIRENGTVHARKAWADFERKALSGDKVILGVKDDTIEWKGRQGTFTTSKKSFLNRFSAIKKRLNLPKARSSVV
jgi:hypothetical protein